MHVSLVVTAAALLTATSAAQTRVTATGTPAPAILDLESGSIQFPESLPSTSAGGSTRLCYDNSLDDDPFIDALLYPSGTELYDWGVKACGGSRFIDRITIGYASQAVPTSQGGPGGSLTLRIYEGGKGFGNPGVPIATLPLTGLPSSAGSELVPFSVQVNLGPQSIRLPDGPIGWSYENTDGTTAPILVDVMPGLGTENFYDVYSPPPARPSSYGGTFTLAPGGVSNDPKENSFYLQLFENDSPASMVKMSAGNNPDIYGAPRPPVLGRVFRLTFDLASVPNMGITMVAFANSRSSGVPFPYGELVVNLDDLACPISVQMTDSHRFEVPMHSSLAGRTLFSQGAYVSHRGWPRLTNGLEFTIGTYITDPGPEG